MQRYLVVANQTLGGQALLDAIRDRLARGPSEFWVVVPASSAGQLINEFNALSCAFPVDTGLLAAAAEEPQTDPTIAAAQAKLDVELQRLRQLGATAAGEVGDPDPLKAIEQALGQSRFDEIILSTLPTDISRWLAWDLPHRIRRRINVPLTVITAAHLHLR